MPMPTANGAGRYVHTTTPTGGTWYLICISEISHMRSAWGRRRFIRLTGHRFLKSPTTGSAKKKFPNGSCIDHVRPISKDGVCTYMEKNQLSRGCHPWSTACRDLCWRHACGSDEVGSLEYNSHGRRTHPIWAWPSVRARWAPFFWAGSWRVLSWGASWAQLIGCACFQSPFSERFWSKSEVDLEISVGCEFCPGVVGA